MIVCGQQTDDAIIELIDEDNSEMAVDVEDDIFGYDFDVTDLDQDVKRTPPSKASLLLQSYGIKLFLAGLVVKQYCFRALDYCLNNKFVNYLISDYVTLRVNQCKNR
jgi:hypothetical protein